jgi:type IV secretory pathway VirB3-like protein
MDDGIPKDMLYLACTRPAMKWGVPVEALMINLGVSYLAFMVVGHANLLSVRGAASVFIFPIVHGAMRMMTDIDHNMFRIVRLAAETRGIQFRGVSVLWAMTWFRPSKARELASGV